MITLGQCTEQHRYMMGPDTFVVFRDLKGITQDLSSGTAAPLSKYVCMLACTTAFPHVILRRRCDCSRAFSRCRSRELQTEIIRNRVSAFLNNSSEGVPSCYGLFEAFFFLTLVCLFLRVCTLATLGQGSAYKLSKALFHA